MPIYEFEGKKPSIGKSSYVHELAAVIGNVIAGNDCFFGAGAVARGDYGRIEIGDRTSVQENSVIHARSGEICKVGSDVQIGHGAILHNCTVSDYAVIGLGSRICDYAKIGIWAIVGEGATVTSWTIIPEGKVAVGVPAKVIRDVTDEEKKMWTSYKQMYAELCERYEKGLKRVE